MKAMNLRLSALGFGLACFGALAACSSDDSSNPTPTPVHDSGVTTPVDGSLPPAQDSGVTPDATPDDDANPGIDAALPDAGGCVSDSSTCNSCFTPVIDPVNGCSPAAANCVKFDNTRVPTAP